MLHNKCKVEHCEWKWAILKSGKVCFRKWYCEYHYRNNRKHWDPLVIKRVLWNNSKKHPLYDIFQAMKDRCINNRNKRYSRYWWRWISVCDRWLWPYWFTNFCTDMWERPVWRSLDRIDNNWNYCKENCRWATTFEQASNREISNATVWVCWRKDHGKWLSRLKIWWKLVLCREFDALQEAIDARKEAELKFIM